ncbi:MULTISPECIES: hypothetical protein [Streptomyces]|uniref:hypothetical protein n=1 Tax=Streptomyces TaxID=1883 RepID=UPI001FFCE9EF|nr:MULTISPECIES: hypothetical protein [Streptomyces]
MRPGPAARTVLALLAAALLALPFLAPDPSFASAQTFGHVRAEERPPTAPTGTAPREERAGVRDCGPAGHGPTGPLRIPRDRHRAADSGPRTPEPPAPGPGHTGAHEAAAPGAGYARASRPAPGRTPAALQVFRH